MKQFFDEIVTTKDSTNEEIFKFCYDKFKEKWKVSKEFDSIKLKEYTTDNSSDFIDNLSVRKLNNMASYVSYITVFYASRDEIKDFINENNTSLEEKNLTLKLLDEVYHYEEEGGACIYLSVLLYCMLIYSNIASEKDIEFIQGFYKFDSTEGIFSLIKNIITMAGVHSFLRVCNKVLDTSLVAQNLECFSYNQNPMIFGEVPKEVKLYGYKESENVVFSYADDICKINNFKSIEEWVESHIQNSINLFINRR